MKWKIGQEVRLMAEHEHKHKTLAGKNLLIVDGEQDNQKETDMNKVLVSHDGDKHWVEGNILEVVE